MNFFKKILSKLASSTIIIACLCFSGLVFADSPKTGKRDALQVLMMQGVSERTVKYTAKIRSCEKKRITFQLNKEDQKYLKQYKEFLVGLSLLSIKNMEQCTSYEEAQLEKEFKKLQQALKVLSITQRTLIELTTEPFYFQLSKSGKKQLDEISKLPIKLRVYLVKRVSDNIYDQSKIFGLMDKHRSL